MGLRGCLVGVKRCIVCKWMCEHGVKFFEGSEIIGVDCRSDHGLDPVIARDIDWIDRQHRFFALRR